jgi:hypothetical protein
MDEEEEEWWYWTQPLPKPNTWDIGGFEPTDDEMERHGEITYS